MHALCAICDELFTGVHPEILHSTSCGHIFHYECLLKWLQRSETCPTCRAKVSETSTIRLYFQIKEATKLKEENKLPRNSVDICSQMMKSHIENINGFLMEIKAIGARLKVLKSRDGRLGGLITDAET